MKANEPLLFTPEMFRKLMDYMSSAIDERDVVTARSLLATLVTDYKPEAHIVDWIHDGSGRNAEQPKALAR